MLMPGQTLLVCEMAPALFAAVAANEAERAAPENTLVDVSMIGASGPASTSRARRRRDRGRGRDRACWPASRAGGSDEARSDSERRAKRYPSTSADLRGSDPFARAALSRSGSPADANVELLSVSENPTYRVEDPADGPDAVLRVHRTGYHPPRRDRVRAGLARGAAPDEGLQTPPLPRRRRAAGGRVARRAS